jgi:nucleoid-associated protein YgaU
MAEDVKPASWVGDTVEEFKRLPTWGKIAIAVVFIGVAVFAYIQLKNASANNSTTSSTGNSSGTDLSSLLGSANNPSLPPTTNTGSTPPTSGGTGAGAGIGAPTMTPTAPASPPPSGGTGAGAGIGAPTMTPTAPASPPPFLTGQPIISPTKVTVPAPTPLKPPSAPKLQTYTVQSGDTLSGIASKLKIAGGWQALYNANKATVDRTAQAHGFYQNDQNWIFPGEKLIIPQG